MLHVTYRGILALLLSLLLLGCRPTSTPAPLSDGGVTPAPASQQLLVLPDDGIGPVLDLIEGAGQSVRFKIYLLTHSEVRSALVRAANRGVDVRVIIERNPVGGGASNQASFDLLQQGGVSVRWAPAALYRLTHEKSLVIDDQTALIGTFNYTVSSFTSNREYGLLIDEPLLVVQIAAIFDADWAAQPYEGAVDPRLVLSPTNSRRQIESVIDSATEMLWLQQATLLDDAIADRLLAAARRGVQVRFIGPLRAGEEDFSTPNYQRLRQAGVDVALLADPQIHAKVIVADRTRALIGSTNLTFSSMELNRELGLVTEEAAVLQRLLATLQADWLRAAQVAVAPPGVISWQEAGDYVGAELTVEGVVVRTHDTGQVTFLNFTQDWRGTLSIVIFASDAGRFSSPPAELYRDRHIRVSGLVKLYQGAPEIVVSSPAQIEILDAESPVALEGERVNEAAVQPQTPGRVVVPWTDARQVMDQTATVEGLVVRTFNSGRATFLNFTQEWRGTFTVVIFAADAGKFAQPPEQLYLDRFIRVTGLVDEYEGAPQIIVRDPGQIEIAAEIPEQVITIDSDPSPTPAAPAAVVPWQQAGDYLGQVITVSGRIVRTHDAGSITFLNFTNERDRFVAVVFSEDYSKFPQPPAQLYDGKQVWITGEISSFRDVPQIVLRGPEQVEAFP